jgi:hypothetical protein
VGGCEFLRSAPLSFWASFLAETGEWPQKAASKSLIPGILHSNPFAFRGLEQVI